MAEEKNLENKVKQFLKDNGCWYVKYWGGGGYTRNGVPDLLVCCKGIFLGVELKASNGRPSELQLHELRMINAAGGIAILLYPDDLNTFKNLIRAISAEKYEMAYACLDKFNERMKTYE